MVAGKYRVERVVGRGAMGMVVAARHVQLDQLVALKLVCPHAASESTVVERFLREARAAAKLRSHHVARVLDVAMLPDGAPYIVMEYLEGADLRQVLEREGPLPFEQACDYIAQACEAVAEAHSLGVVHRDLKPDNLYLTSRLSGEGFIKVLDFGISKLTTAQESALTQTRALVGSPLYMAPEQIRSARDADARSDVWALGVVLFELLTRRYPFEAESLPDLCMKVTRDAPRSILELRDDLPEGLVRVVDRCLEKDPAARFANAAELASALAPFVPSHSLQSIEAARHVVRVSTGERSVPPFVAPRVRSRRAVSWIAGAGGAAVLSIGAALVLVARDGAGHDLALARVDAALVSVSVASAIGTTAAADTVVRSDAAIREGGETSPRPSERAAAPTAIATERVGARPVPPVHVARPAAVAPAKSTNDDIPAFR
jgi:serine/threonine-protein kinase